MKKLVSIIVPVFNVEKYLRQCLDSILGQTFNQFEVIIVNDGSTDNSGAICQEYEARDNRIVYLEKENGGVSEARNLGLDFATSEYIIFIDSDDWIEPTYVEVLYEKIEEYQADIVFENYTSFNDEDSNFYFHMSNDYYEEIYDNYSVMNLLNDSRESKNAALIVPWAKIYRKEILNDLHFPLARTGEDALFNLKVFLKSEKIVYIHKGSYIYRHRGESLSRNWTVDWFNESLLIQEERLSMLATLGYPLRAYKKGYMDSLNFFISEIENRKLPKSHIFSQMKEKRDLLNYLTLMHKDNKKAIILVSHFRNLYEIQTTIKSICFHNRSLRFYLVNHDFPCEWFQLMDRRLEEFDSEIVDCRIPDNGNLNHECIIYDIKSLYSVIGDFVGEDKVLYLGQNVIITKKLDDLFDMDMGEYPVATVREHDSNMSLKQGKFSFDTGVILVNISSLKKEKAFRAMTDKQDESSVKVEGVCQNNLDCLCKSNWLELDSDGNFLNHCMYFTNDSMVSDQDFPGIISYSPYGESRGIQSNQEYRNIWWFYHNIEWTELGGNYHLHALRKHHLDSALR